MPAVFLALLATAALSAGQLSSRPAGEWSKVLETPARLAGLKEDQVISRIGLKPGDVIADLGAGTGVFSIPMAKAVAPRGKVYAVEIDEGFLPIIAGKAKDAGVANVRTVLGKFTDPGLPAQDVDVAFFHDVLHHIDDKGGYLKGLARYVKPSGRIVVIDLKAETSPHKDQPELVVTPAQIGGWMAAAGFRLVQDVADVFPDKYFLVFAR